MSTLHQLREGLNEVWETFAEGWQRLYQRAAGAITRFTPGKKATNEPDESQEISIRSSGWGVLASEVFDDGDEIIVRLEIPGMDKNDLDIQVQDEHLVIRGERKVEREHKEGKYYVTERAYGQFERAIPLPDEVDADKAKASYKRGVLTVKCPKSENRRHKKIMVDVS